MVIAVVSVRKGVNPSHGREGCQFTAQLFQHPEFDVCDLLDGARTVKYWGITRLLPGKWRCDGCK